jgi:type VI secretion system secreted protein VgrG
MAPVVLQTPLPPADVRFGAMRCSEGVSTLGDMEVSLLSARADLKPADLLGKPMTVTAALREGGQRHFHGFVTRFGLGARQGRYFGYRATVSPWLWFLTRSTDCRIFQNETVPQIVEKVFKDYGFADYAFKLFRTYRPWVHCVQYRESDFNFVARLLEHEGIYWWFEHTEKAHRLVLVDSQSAHDPAPGCESLPFVEQGATSAPDTDCVHDWTYAQQVRSGKVALASYDFERPSTDLSVEAEQPREHDQASLEVFDWQGDYVQKADGTQIAEDRRDELQTPWETFRGSSNAQGIEPGRKLGLTRHARADFNADYVVTSVQHQAWGDGAEAGQQAGGYGCEFTAIRASQQYRPPRRTPKPFVQGPQTAVVVGPAGEEIFTDKYGRVKLHFHWDRESKKDEKSSCWVRVSHPWAGKNFGIVDIPRIGQEVVVDFLEGDPDQPLVTGRVYNAEQMPPWDLPANATQSGILTRSSKGGAYGNANAIRFEDKKGSEQLWIHAEKNQDIEVENDETHWVGHDRRDTVDHDETVRIGNNRSVRVGGFKTETVALAKAETIGLAKALTIGAGYAVTVGLGQQTTIGKTLSVDVGDAIEIKTGKSVLRMDSDGTIELIGARIKIAADGPTVIVGKDVDINP